MPFQLSSPASQMMLGKRLFRSMSTTRQGPTKNWHQTRLPNGRKRQAVRSKLCHVGRVHAPEADMRPVLPLRNVLLKCLQMDYNGDRATRCSSKCRPRKGLAELADESAIHARGNDMNALEMVVKRALHPNLVGDIARRHRVVAMNAIIGGIQSSVPEAVDGVMSVLAAHGVFDLSSEDDIGAVLDVLVRHKLFAGDVTAAFRGELMSRAFNSRVCGRTYTALIEKCERLDAALSLLHRAVAVGVQPSVSMLNRILELCFEYGDTGRARRVVAEMARRGLRPNMRTLTVLLEQANGIEGVDAVFGAVRRSGYAPDGSADIFLRAYASIGSTTSDNEYIGRCFSVIDWFFDCGIGVCHRALDNLIEHFACHGHVEAALRAWREMRRGWLGSPSMRSSKALWVQLIERDSARDEELRKRLKQTLTEEQIEQLNRTVLRELDNANRDEDALNGTSIKDQATVLHRWARTGRVNEVEKWIESAIAKCDGKGVDVRLLLPLLSDTGKATRLASVMKLFGHLSSGRSVRGEKDVIVQRVTDRLWKWVVTESENWDIDDCGAQGIQLTDGQALDLEGFKSMTDIVLQQQTETDGSVTSETEMELEMVTALLDGLDKIVRVCEEDDHI